MEFYPCNVIGSFVSSLCLTPAEEEYAKGCVFNFITIGVYDEKVWGDYILDVVDKHIQKKSRCPTYINIAPNKRTRP